LSGFRPEILVVAGECPWPARSGGAVRTSALIDALRSVATISVATPTGAAAAPEGIRVVELSRPSGSRLRAYSRPEPRLGLDVIDATGRRILAEAVQSLQPRAVLFAHSYLAAAAGPVEGALRVVDFANLETRRLASFARAGRLRNRVPAAIEAVKAARWEPATARDADLAIAVDELDAQQLTAWGARVIVVPNAHHRPSTAPQPSETKGPVTYLASMSYRPNRVGGAELIRSIWPLVRARVPDARLVVTGRDAGAHFAWADGQDGIEVHSDPEDVEAILAAASLVVVPVRQGGGTQLKVTQALGHGRLPVVTDYSARSIPGPLRSLCPVADSEAAFATAICELVEAVDERHRRERLVLAAGLPDWDMACRPLLEAIASRMNSSEAA
jgi:hypothetical protein